MELGGGVNAGQLRQYCPKGRKWENENLLFGVTDAFLRLTIHASSRRMEPAFFTSGLIVCRSTELTPEWAKLIALVWSGRYDGIRTGTTGSYYWGENIVKRRIIAGCIG